MFGTCSIQIDAILMVSTIDIVTKHLQKYGCDLWCDLVVQLFQIYLDLGFVSMV